MGLGYHENKQLLFYGKFFSHKSLFQGVFGVNDRSRRVEYGSARREITALVAP